MTPAVRLLAVAALTVSSGGCSDARMAGEVPVNPGIVETDDGLFTLVLAPSSDPYGAGEPVELQLEVVSGGADIADVTVAVSAFMPDMGHGLDEEPQTSGDGVVFVAAWTFSMAGYWELDIDVEAAEGADTVTVAYAVE